MLRHFLRLSDLSADDLTSLLCQAEHFKRHRGEGFSEHLRNSIVALYMELPSTRTRLSFQVAAAEMGGGHISIDKKNIQIDRGEPIEDFARVCSELFAALVVRSISHQRIIEFTKFCNIPVINALSDEGHPCQVLADLMTLRHHFPSIQDLNIVWLGDGNNVCRSWIEAAGILGLSLRVTTPSARQPRVSKLPDTVKLFPDNPREALAGADVLMTDVWESMGSTKLITDEIEKFLPYQINHKAVAYTGKNPVILHCMPMHRGEEISAEIVSGSGSHIYEQAGNRLHAHKAILQFLLCPVD